MLVEKFDYKPIPRKQIDGKRLYDTPFGPVPSVTTILDKTKPREVREALANWRKAVGHQKAQEITTEAANRGTRMHKYLEDYVKDGRVLPIPGSNPFAQQANKMADQIVRNGLCHVDEVWGMEVPLYFPEIYAGTTDLVGVHKGDPAIMDYKQTNKPKNEERVQDYYIQLTAYAEAHNEVYGTNIRKGVVLMCSAAFEYQEFILEGKRWDDYRRKWWTRVEEFYTA